MASDSVKSPGSIYSIYMPNEAISMDPVAFDSFVNNYGVRLIHFRATPCPIGLDEPNDLRRIHEDHSACSNGFIFTPVGRVTCLFLSNSTHIQKLGSGFVDGSSVSVTFPRYYDNDTKRRVMVRPYDRFYLEEKGIEVAATNLMKRRIDGRPDKPGYPAIEVHSLMDSSGVLYHQGVDFVVDRGDVTWADGKGPAAGKTYSIWYTYSPYWYCVNLVHEVRVVPVKDFVNANQIRNERLSFAAVLNREYVHRDKTPDLLSPDVGGRQQAPPDINLVEAGVDPSFG